MQGSPGSLTIDPLDAVNLIKNQHGPGIQQLIDDAQIAL